MLQSCAHGNNVYEQESVDQLQGVYNYFLVHDFDKNIQFMGHINVQMFDCSNSKFHCVGSDEFEILAAPRCGEINWNAPLSESDLNLYGTSFVFFNNESIKVFLISYKNNNVSIFNEKYGVIGTTLLSQTQKTDANQLPAYKIKNANYLDGNQGVFHCRQQSQ